MSNDISRSWSSLCCCFMFISCELPSAPHSLFTPVHPSLSLWQLHSLLQLGACMSVKGNHAGQPLHGITKIGCCSNHVIPSCFQVPDESGHLPLPHTLRVPAGWHCDGRWGGAERARPLQGRHRAVRMAKPCCVCSCKGYIFGLHDFVRAVGPQPQPQLAGGGLRFGFIAWLSCGRDHVLHHANTTTHHDACAAFLLITTMYSTHAPTRNVLCLCFFM